MHPLVYVSMSECYNTKLVLEDKTQNIVLHERIYNSHPQIACAKFQCIVSLEIICNGNCN